MNYFLYALTAIAAIDLIILFIRTFFGSASDFMYYLCRPYGISCLSMFVGFVIRLIEAALVGASVCNIVESLTKVSHT